MTHPEAPATPVSTPEVPEPAGAPATLPRRAAARTADVAGWVAVLFALDRLTTDLTVVWSTLWSLAWLVLPVWRGGATAGKRLCRLRVVRGGGGPLSLGRALAREAFFLASVAVPVIGVLNVLTVVNDPRRQSLSDKVADTLVVDRAA